MPGRILIVDDISVNRILLKAKLTAASYHVVLADSGDNAMDTALNANPDLILLDVMLPGPDGVETCRRLKQDPRTRAIPVVMVSASDAYDVRIGALEAGADDFLLRPFDVMTLLARVRSLMRAAGELQELGRRRADCASLGLAESRSDITRPFRIALIGRNHGNVDQLRKGLAQNLSGQITLLHPEQALYPPSFALDAYIVSDDLDPANGGLRFLSQLRSTCHGRNAVIILMLGQVASQQAVLALDLGASDIVSNDVSTRELSLRLRTQMRRKREADALRRDVDEGLKLAAKDPLTGLHNRRYAMSYMEQLTHRRPTNKATIAVMLLDLDQFKSVNDCYGHRVGDLVLAEVGARLQASVRPTDLVARIGGEEFLVLLQDTDLFHTRTAAERLRRVVEDQPIRTDQGVDLKITMSLGVAMGGVELPADMNVQDLLHKADRALYAAKADGRNKVSFACTIA